MRADRHDRDFQRRLIHIPIIHTETDMGGLSGPVQRVAVRMMGVGGWRRRARSVDEMWAGIELAIERLELSYDSVRLYQDGLPVCGREPEIVRELAGKGSLNHRLLLRLIQKGASLMGTESVELLVEEYARAKEAASAHKRGRMLPARPFEDPPGGSLLERRDRFIAARINGTLRAGETGILFLGMLHSLDDLLDEDIRVLYPTRQLSHREGKI